MVVYITHAGSSGSCKGGVMSNLKINRASK